MNGSDHGFHIAHGKAMEYKSVGLKHRKGGPLFKILFSGEEGSANNYMLALAQQSNFFSPRHKHNFEQFRFPIRGDFSIGTDPEVVLHEGELGYFPEGVEYGPQFDGDETKETLILQFGGPSRQGFVSYAKLATIQSELQKEGRFEGGKFYRRAEGPEDEELVIDGYQAMWEKCNNGLQLSYPKGRYSAPVLMEPSAFQWKPAGQRSFRKLLGMFSERETVADMIRVEEGGSFHIEAQPNAVQLLYVAAARSQRCRLNWEQP